MTLNRREEIIDLLKHRYAEKRQENLPIFGIEKSHLTDFTTTEKDMKRMVSRFPPDQLRLTSEDIIKQPDAAQLAKLKLGDSSIEEGAASLDDLQQNVEIRNKQF